MSFPAGLALLDVLYPLVGAAFLSLIGIAGSMGAGVRLLGLSYLTGYALLGVVLSLWLMAGLPLTVASVLIVAAVIFAACAAGAWRGVLPAIAPRARVAPWRYDRLVSAAGVAVLAVGGAAAVVTALRGEWNPAHDFDAVFIYLPRAVAISTTHGLDITVWRRFVHAEYPPLFMVSSATTFAFAGFHPSLLPFQQALLALAFLLGALGLLDRVAPRWLSVPALALLGTAPWFWASFDSLLPDQTLGYLVAVAALACVLWLLEPRPAWLALGTLFLAAATLTKLEGTLSAVTLVAVVVVVSLVHFGRRRGAWAAVFLFGPATEVFWRLWLHSNGLRGTTDVYSISNIFDPSYLSARTSRLKYAIASMEWTGGRMLAGVTPLTRTATSGRLEAEVLLAGLVVLLVFAARSSGAVAVTVGCWFVLAVAGLATIYWIGRIPVAYYVAESVDRVEETPAMVILTLLPLLLALALRLVRPDPTGDD